ncbi:protein-arginine deiminase type-1-like isoform X2 [Xenopus tropicalis]|uniref:Protein-arginine deiminase type-1-like isoform X2 n=1 Tax=Xenopus tropicalis TaxID=8364 RepID=A0A8J1JY88_XENTR|nr:protein-arginine deiminase type-1-like isoform X2 [Xenopus tropicalis]
MGAPNAADIKDLSPMVLSAEGPEEIFEGHNLILSISPTHATKLRVYCKRKSDYLLVLGGTNLSHEVEKGNSQEMGFYVEGLDFPDADFSGLVHINLSFCRSSDSTEIFADRVAFRVAPWIMTPNTQKPLEVYVCSVQGNKKFLKELKDLVQKAKCKLNICPDVENRGDRWIQGPDFGYVKIQVEQRDSVSDLDSFGNLEVSPPVAVKGKNYPLGRILIGSHLPQDIEPPNPQPIKPRRMNKAVRDFLSAQLVQSPVELYSDWLMVGHIDEFMSFVPVPNKKGFRLLLASPRMCLELFREKQNEGYGGAIMFEGLSTEPHTIEKLLSNEKLLRDSTYTQGCIDRNRQILKEELGLSEGDITDIPALFTLLPYYNKAEAFYPNMVNMLVLGQYLAIPKPFGPLIDGRCCLEQKVCSLLEPQGLICTFLDDFATYHQNAGNVHCGTNVIRKPFPQKWWHCLP